MIILGGTLTTGGRLASVKDPISQILALPGIVASVGGTAPGTVINGNNAITSLLNRVDGNSLTFGSEAPKLTNGAIDFGPNSGRNVWIMGDDYDVSGGFTCLEPSTK